MEFIERPIKLETIRRSVAECDNHSIPAVKERLIAMCSQWWGTERRKALEYLNELETIDEIVIDGNDIWLRSRWTKILKTRSKEYPNAKVFESIRKEVTMMNDEDKQLAKKIIEGGAK